MVLLLFCELLRLMVHKISGYISFYVKYISGTINKNRKADQYRFIRKNSSCKLKTIEIENLAINSYNIQGQPC